GALTSFCDATSGDLRLRPVLSRLQRHLQGYHSRTTCQTSAIVPSSTIPGRRCTPSHRRQTRASDRAYPGAVNQPAAHSRDTPCSSCRTPRLRTLRLRLAAIPAENKPLLTIS